MAEETVTEEEFEKLAAQKPIEYLGVERALPIYADVAAIRHTDQAFQLIFFQIAPPITNEKDALEKLESIPAYCIGKIVVSPPQMFQLYAAIKTNIEQWNELMQRRKAELEAHLATATEKEGK
jgi:hypothetical protein